MQDQPQAEQSPRTSQKVVNVEGSLFIVTELFRTDVDGVEFCTFRTTSPYKGSVDDRKAELEAAAVQIKEEFDAKDELIKSQLADIDNIEAEATPQ